MNRILGILIGVALISSSICNITQSNRIADLEARMDYLEDQHTVVLQSCKTTGQICREVIARLTGGQNVSKE